MSSKMQAKILGNTGFALVIVKTTAKSSPLFFKKQPLYMEPALCMSYFGLSISFPFKLV